MSDLAPALSALEVEGWLVGGAVRDRLLGRSTSDYDLVIAGETHEAARALARSLGGHAFKLSDGFGAWRVVVRDRPWQVDLLPLQGGAITADLAQRDLTVNAVAEPLGGGELVDPFGGVQDLHAGRLRMVSPHAFAQDPLRVLRLARLACELGFTPEPETATAAGRSAPALDGVAPERIFAEFKRLMSSERAVEGLRLMDELGITPVVLPELSALTGVEQSRYHHLDVQEHTRAVLAEAIALERDPSAVFGHQAPALAELLEEPLADDLTRAQALRLGALFHDVAKPRTRGVTEEGRVTFIGHDAAGAQLVYEVLQRLRASERLCQHVAALTRHHLRLGFLVHEMPLSRRVVYRYLKACAPVQVDVSLLSVADRLATRGSGSEPAIARHLGLARELMADALAWRADPPRPPVRGDELAQAAGVRPGPELGRILAELEEASFAGEIGTREQALQRGAELLRSER